MATNARRGEKNQQQILDVRQKDIRHMMSLANEYIE